MKGVLVSLAALGMAAQVGMAAEQRYDLGGPCREEQGIGQYAELLKAEKSGNWSRVVELQKLSVRASCGNDYRWLLLIKALIRAGREGEAVQVFAEMEARGFDLSPSRVENVEPVAANFMTANPLFAKAAVGGRIGRLKAVSDERRGRFREMLAAIPESQRPPEVYVARGACPFECCRFGQGTAVRETALVAEPGSLQVVGKADKGARVLVLTGEVYLKPEPVGVVAEGPLPKGSIAFVLDYQGEGYGHVYSKGKVMSIFLGYAEYCFQPSETCWGETILPASEKGERVWWIKVRLANGVTGWTEKTGNFEGMDGCG